MSLSEFKLTSLSLSLSLPVGLFSIRVYSETMVEPGMHYILTHLLVTRTTTTVSICTPTHPTAVSTFIHYICLPVFCLHTIQLSTLGSHWSLRAYFLIW